MAAEAHLLHTASHGKTPLPGLLCLSRVGERIPSSHALASCLLQRKDFSLQHSNEMNMLSVEQRMVRAGHSQTSGSQSH